MKKKYLIITLFISLFFTTTSVISEEKKVIESGHNYNIYTGMFDFSDDGKKSQVLGFQHKNNDLFRDSFLGTIKPVTGFMFTADNATYLYTLEYKQNIR